MAIDPKININENQVVFRRDVGHNHDGLTSSLIDYKKYSVFDFVPFPIAAPNSPRRVFQDNNVRSFKSFIVSAVEERVLNPQGIRIQANAITAREIVAGTITANELTSNIVLVNNIIRSTNFDGTFHANGVINSTGTTGWGISYAGSSVFNNATIRGRLTAGDIYIPSVASPVFSVASNGALTATSAAISGVLTAGVNSTIGGWTADSSRLFRQSANNLMELVSVSDPRTSSVLRIVWDNFPAAQRTILTSTVSASGFGFSTNATGLSSGLGYLTKTAAITASGDLELNEDNGTVNPANIESTAVRASGITTSGFVSASTFLSAGTTITAGGNISTSGTLLAFSYKGTTADIDSGSSNFATVAIRRNYTGVSDKRFITFLRGSTEVGRIKYVDGNGDKIEYLTTSDGRLKKDIKPIQNALEIINKIEPVSYVFKSGSSEEHGFIAQDMYEVYDKVVSKPLTDDERWMLNYAGMTPLLTAGIKDLHKEITQLKKRINELESKE